MRRRRALHAFRIDHRSAVVGIVVVEAVDDVVVVFWTVPVRRRGKKPTTRSALNTGLQVSEILEVASQQRQLIDSLVGKSPTQYIGRSVDHRCFFRNGHGDRKSTR